MNPILQRSLEVATRATGRSAWFRDTLIAIQSQKDSERTALGAYELLRVVKRFQNDAIFEHNRKGNPSYEREDPPVKPRLHELTDCAMRQYLGLPVPEPDLDYNRFLIRYEEDAGWLYRFDEDRDFPEFDRTGIAPPIMRALDPNNPPGLWGKLFEVPRYVQPINRTTEEEILRIESSPVSASWLSQAMRSIPKDEEDVYHRHLVAEGRYILSFAAAIHRDTPPDMGGDIPPPGQKHVFRFASGQPEVLNVFKTVPDERVVMPRDNYSVSITKDAPFLAYLLQKGVQGIHEVQDERLRTYCFYDHAEAERFAKENWVKAPESYSAAKIRKRFGELFWHLRRLLSLEKNYRCSIRLGELILKHPDEAVPSEALRKFAENLRHPFTLGDDPLIHDPGKIRFYDWEATEPGVTFCPIDGPVPEPLLFHHSGRPTMDECTACPHCLGALYWKEILHVSY